MALKVYRTAIGFHDAYVAAPSQKAALTAWGADKDLFARGVAELVTDDNLTADALARPGEVVRRLRASAEEQMAAAQPAPAVKPRKPVRKLKPSPLTPRPDRKAVEAATQAMAEAEARQRETEASLAAEERALAERRRLVRADWIADRERLAATEKAAEEAYAAALATWQRDQDGGIADR